MKKKLSRLLCALLVMTMVLAMVPAVSAAEVYDSYKNTNKTATVTLGNEVTITFPHSTSKHDQQIVLVGEAANAFTCENEKHPGRLTPKNSAVDSSKTDGAK